MHNLKTLLITGALAVTSNTAMAAFSESSSGGGWLESADASFTGNMEARLRCGNNCAGGGWTSAWFNNNGGTTSDTATFALAEGVDTPFTLSYEPTTSTYTFSAGGNAVTHQVDAAPNQAYCKMGLQLRRVTSEASTAVTVTGLSINGDAQNDYSLNDATTPNNRLVYASFANSDADAITDVSGNVSLTWGGATSDESAVFGLKFAVGDPADICTYVAPAAPVDTTSGVAPDAGAAAPVPPAPIPVLPLPLLGFMAALLGLVGVRASRR